VEGDGFCAVRAAAAEAEPIAGSLAVGAPLLTEDDLFAVWALVDAHVASVSLGRGGGRCLDLAGDGALAVGLLPAGGGAVGLPVAKNPRVQLHFTPTSGSWLNLVEIFFGIITRQAIRRGTFTSVKDLITVIETFIDGWNERCEPFTWTKTADEIIGKINRKRTNATRH